MPSPPFEEKGCLLCLISSSFFANGQRSTVDSRFEVGGTNYETENNVEHLTLNEEVM
jgi:hypothetical protein